MRGWLRHHGHSLADAVKRLVRTPFTALLNMLVIGTAVTLPIAGYVAIENLRGLGSRLAGDSQVSVFMSADATRADVARIESRLRAAPIVERVEFVSKEVAFAALKKNSALSDVMATLKSNPLPDALVVFLGKYQPHDAEALAEEIKREAKVAQVQLDAVWMRRLGAFLEVGRLVLTGLAVVLAVGLVAVTFNTVRLQILTRADEIEVARLVGATDRFIRRPFFYYAALTGLFGSLIGWGAVVGALVVLNREIATLAMLYATEFQFLPPHWTVVVSAVCAAVLLALAGAWASASVHLHRTKPM